jgi:hypothetical protein
MKTTFTALLLTLCTHCASGQSSNGWYGVQTMNVTPNHMRWTDVPHALGGTVTKLRAAVLGGAPGSILRLALYDSAGSLLCFGSNSIPAPGAVQFVECAVTPTVVPAGTNRIAVATPGNIDMWNASTNSVLGTNLFSYWATNGDAIFPPATLPAPAGTNTQAPNLGLYLD